jgi:amyloid beta (A4) precursor protein-binding family B protein 2 (Fe65-like)
MGQNNEHNNQLTEDLINYSPNNELIDNENCESSEELPIGWERHEDESGPYFWHIPSGTIQRERPFGHSLDTNKTDSVIYFDSNEHTIEKNVDNKAEDNNSISFLVHSLGWMEVKENQLTSATSSKVIQKCIHELSTRGDNNAVRCWGRQTQQLLLKIDNSFLKLYDSTSNTLLNCQPIESIRVWGVNDNNDFAYVARDSTNTTSSSPQTTPVSPTTPTSCGLKCHVFHCEDDNNSAQRIATFLRDEMILLKMNNESPSIPLSHNQRPKHLFIYDSNTPSTIATPTAIEFPTPIEEPKKTIAAKYLGKTKVSKPMGIEVLNAALETVLYNDESPQSEESVKRTYVPVLVHISPSNILIESKETAECIVECRVRFDLELNCILDEKLK